MANKKELQPDNKEKNKNKQAEYIVEKDEKLIDAIIAEASRLNDAVRRIQGNIKKNAELVIVERRRVTQLKEKLKDRTKELAYYTSEQTGGHASMPWNYWSDAEKHVASTVESYLHILSTAGSKTAGWSKPNDDVSSRLREFYSPGTYLDQLKELAYFYWWSAGRQSGMLLDFWFQFEKSVDDGVESLIRSMTSAATTSPEWPKGFQGAFDIPRESFSPAKYVDRVSELAYYMWQYSGQRYGTSAFTYWSDAERHISTLTASALERAGSTIDAARELSEAFAEFSPQAHLDRIREAAFYMWEKQNRPHGHALDNWIAAEKAALSRLERRTKKSPK